jgi:hypothetical protein
MFRLRFQEDKQRGMRTEVTGKMERKIGEMIQEVKISFPESLPTSTYSPR